MATAERMMRGSDGGFERERTRSYELKDKGVMCELSECRLAGLYALSQLLTIITLIWLRIQFFTGLIHHKSSQPLH